MSFNSVNYIRFRHSLVELIESTVPNFILAEVKWKNLSEKYINRPFIKNEHEYMITAALFENFKNPHMEFIKLTQASSFYPILFFVGKLDVFICRAEELNEYSDITNNKLISIDGKDVKEIRKEVESKYFKFSQGVKDKQLIKVLRNTMKGKNAIECTINCNNESKLQILNPITITELEEGMLNNTELSDFVLKNYDHYIYFKPSSFQVEKCSDICFASLCNNERDILVLDLRYNSGGLIKEAQKFLGFFLAEATHIGYKLKKKETNDIIEPIVIYPGSDRLKFNTIYILTNRYTMSSSEFIVIEGLKRTNKNVIVIGEESSGLYSEAERHKCTDGSSFQVLSSVIVDMFDIPIYRGVIPDIFIYLDFLSPVSTNELMKYLDIVNERMKL